MEDKPEKRKGRGAQINPASRFDELHFDKSTDPEAHFRTEHIDVHPKSILNKVDSPDIGFTFSLNPYQGCEHGCVYCYARNTHPYWGYSAGIDFEQKILIKKSAPQLLEKTLRKKSWKAVPIMLAGNTDVYQPAEKKYELTRSILKICWKYRHPVGLITKNSLVLRDLDVLQDLASEQLVHATISFTSLNEKLRRELEPRTSSVSSRLKTIEQLAKAGIPVNVMLAPIIPGLNDHEILAMAKAVADAGAISIGYTLVRLNGDVGVIFEDWLRKTYPDRAEKVLNGIKDCRNGQLSDSNFSTRIKGQGSRAEIITEQFRLAKRKYFYDKKWPAYNTELHEQYKDGQLKLF